jgi:predicted enzyme related to lactoylglutathione lyase
MKKDDFGDAGDVMCVFPAERGGVSGALVKRASQQPSSSGTMVYLNCDGELDGTIARVPGAGGKILMKRTPVPGGFGAFACFKDSEGNHVGIHTSI